MKVMKIYQSALILMTAFVSSIFLFASCEEREPVTVKIDYFPLQTAAHWKYLYETYDDETHELIQVDTVEMEIYGDTLILDKTYKIIVVECETIYVRKEGSQYIRYYENSYEEIYDEYKFFDEGLHLNSSWEYKKTTNLKYEYKIVAKHDFKTILDKTYKDVIEIEKSSLYFNNDEWVKNIISNHFYANGIGEIYADHRFASRFCKAYISGYLKVSLITHHQ